jgi:uncharacterized protein (TIGR03083 family)
MSSRADRTISALRSGHDDLVGLVDGLGPDDLSRPSGASEWTVAQVLSHLGSGAEINLAALEHALGGPAPGSDFAKTVWARWDGMTPAEQAASFPAANEKLVRRYEGLDEQTRADLRVDLGFIPVPVDVATSAGLRLTEFALHAWDVRVAFEPAATLPPEAADLLVDGIGMLLGFVGKADRLDGTAHLAVRTTAPDRSFGLAITDTVAFTDRPDPADGELTAPTEYLIRLVNGRHGAAYTPDSVTVTGGTLSLDDLRQVFPGY